jgi:hypothetical protein
MVSLLSYVAHSVAVGIVGGIGKDLAIPVIVGEALQ